MWTFRGPRISESAKTASKWYVCSIYFMFPFYFTPENLCWGSVTNVRACEPEPQAASREPFLRATAFILIYSFIFWRFQFNVNVFLSKWCTWQKKHKFSIFFRAWNFAQVVSVVCWRSVYSFTNCTAYCRQRWRNVLWWVLLRNLYPITLTAVIALPGF